MTFSDVMLNKTTAAVVAGMDTIARRIIGPANIERLEELDEIYIQQLREQCHSNLISPRSSRRLPGEILNKINKNYLQESEAIFIKI